MRCCCSCYLLAGWLVVVVLVHLKSVGGGVLGSVQVELVVVCWAEFKVELGVCLAHSG